jgi:hypothetical protein
MKQRCRKTVKGFRGQFRTTISRTLKPDTYCERYGNQGVNGMISIFCGKMAFFFKKKLLLSFSPILGDKNWRFS